MIKEKGVITLPDYITGLRDKQRAIERWENEGGRSIYTDFMEAQGRERNDARAPDEGATVGVRPSPAGNYRAVQGA